jgi:ankyrin repeat protein
VKSLIRHGASVEARSLDLETPLMIAIKKSQNDCIDLLLKSNAKVNCVNSRGNYPIHIVAEQGSVERLGSSSFVCFHSCFCLSCSLLLLLVVDWFL